MDMYFSIAFHLQTKGQSARMIQMLENFLRPYVEQRLQTRIQTLAMVEFAVNNTVNVAIGYSPFYLNSSDHPMVP